MGGWRALRRAPTTTAVSSVVSSTADRKGEVFALLARVVDLLFPDGGRDFFSTSHGAWPPGAKSRRHARDLIRRVPGHARTGVGRQTVWRVECALFDAYYRMRLTRSRAEAIDRSQPDLDALADNAIRGAKYRATKKA